MKKKFIRLSISAITVLCVVVAYLTIDDLNYLVPPDNILKPLSVDQISHWNHFVTATTQLVANAEDKFDEYLTKYLAVAQHPELVQNTVTGQDTYFPASELIELSPLVCKRFSELASKGLCLEAADLISQHIVILRNVRNGARQTFSACIATHHLNLAFEAIDQHMNSLSAETKQKLYETISAGDQVTPERIVERDYVLNMNLYMSAVTNRLPGFWMPKDTANEYAKIIRKCTQIIKNEGVEAARQEEDQFIEGLPHIRNYVGTLFMMVSLPTTVGTHDLLGAHYRKQQQLLEKLQNKSTHSITGSAGSE